MRFAFHFAVACVVACGLAACGITNPSDLKTEPPFSDSVGPGGLSNTFFFSTTGTGEFTAKMTALAPDNGAVMTANVGTPANNNGVASCSVEYQAQAGFGKTFFDQQLPKGDYCFQIVDLAGALTRTESFTVVIAHV